MTSFSYLLGCNHSLAFNGRALGQAVAFPAPSDQQPVANHIGRVAVYVRLRPAAWPLRWNNPGPPNPVDCALAEIRASTVVAPRTVITGPIALGTPVRKIGRTSGHTSSTIRIKKLSGFVDLGGGTYYFDDYVGVVSDPPFAHPGDSGALAVVKTSAPGDLTGIGLVTARTYCPSDPYKGYIVAICRLENVLDHLAAQIRVAPGQMTVKSL